jgi:hypothetical protein
MRSCWQWWFPNRLHGDRTNALFVREKSETRWHAAYCSVGTSVHRQKCDKGYSLRLSCSTPSSVSPYLPHTHISGDGWPGLAEGPATPNSGCRRPSLKSFDSSCRSAGHGQQRVTIEVVSERVAQNGFVLAPFVCFLRCTAANRAYSALPFPALWFAKVYRSAGARRRGDCPGILRTSSRTCRLSGGISQRMANCSALLPRHADGHAAAQHLG